VTISGEFSSSYRECGLFLAGTQDATTSQSNCTEFIQWQSWNATFKQGILDFTEAEMDALQNWWYWTWKVCLSSRRRKLLDIEADIVHPLIGWQFICLRSCGVTPVVVQTWTGKRLDTDRPTQKSWKVQGIKRSPSCLPRYLFFVADRGCGGWYNRSVGDGGRPVASYDHIRCLRSHIRRPAHVHANWHHPDTASCSTHAIGVGG
jgi:hypothetical protein